MSEDTRDIAIATKTEVARLREDVREMRDEIAEFKRDLNERRGMEKLAGWMRTTIGGGIGSGLTIVASKLMGLPLPK